MKTEDGFCKSPMNLKNWRPATIDIDDISISDKYKYLGTILTPKLSCGEQISYIRRKSGFLLVKLYP